MRDCDKPGGSRRTWGTVVLICNLAVRHHSSAHEAATYYHPGAELKCQVLLVLLVLAKYASLVLLPAPPVAGASVPLNHISTVLYCYDVYERPTPPHRTARQLRAPY